MASSAAIVEKAAAVTSSEPAIGLLSGNANVIYLMGLSFILGSLFTIFILILLDFMRRHNHRSAGGK